MLHVIMLVVNVDFLLLSLLLNDYAMLLLFSLSSFLNDNVMLLLNVDIMLFL